MRVTVVSLNGVSECVTAEVREVCSSVQTRQPRAPARGDRRGDRATRRHRYRQLLPSHAGGGHRGRAPAYSPITSPTRALFSRRSSYGWTSDSMPPCCPRPAGTIRRSRSAPSSGRPGNATSTPEELPMTRLIREIEGLAAAGRLPLPGAGFVRGRAEFVASCLMRRGMSGEQRTHQGDTAQRRLLQPAGGLPHHRGQGEAPRPPSRNSARGSTPASRRSATPTGPSTATVFVLIGGQVSWAVSASFVVADAGLVLSSAAPCRPVQDVLDGRGLAVGEAGDQASDLGEAEVDELGGSVSDFPRQSSSRARRTVRQAWAAMARVMWRCQPG